MATAHVEWDTNGRTVYVRRETVKGKWFDSLVSLSLQEAQDEQRKDPRTRLIPAASSGVHVNDAAECWLRSNDAQYDSQRRGWNGQPLRSFYHARSSQPRSWVMNMLAATDPARYQQARQHILRQWREDPTPRLLCDRPERIREQNRPGASWVRTCLAYVLMEAGATPDDIVIRRGKRTAGMTKAFDVLHFVIGAMRENGVAKAELLEASGLSETSYERALARGKELAEQVTPEVRELGIAVAKIARDGASPTPRTVPSHSSSSTEPEVDLTAAEKTELLESVREIKATLREITASSGRSLDNPGETLSAYTARTHGSRVRDARDPGSNARDFLRPRLHAVA